MRLRHVTGLTAAAVTTVLGLPIPAATAAAAVLVVNNNDPARCSDAGAGTVAQPYCTISAAAKAAEPGQTVRVLPSLAGYQEEVHVTRSGTADKPITFLGGTLQIDNSALPTLHHKTPGEKAFVLSNVHDVVVRGFQDGDAETAVAVSDSSRVTVDQNLFTLETGPAAVRVSGASDHVTVSRNLFLGSAGVLVEGARSTLVTANDFNSVALNAVTVTDAPDSAVTNNTVAFPCGAGVVLGGASTGAVVENNLITMHNAGNQDDRTCAGKPAPVVVSAGAAGSAKVDYNTVHPWPGGTSYDWAGTGYPTVAAFRSATGQGGHDADLDTAFDPYLNWPFNQLPDSATAAIDSGDPAAPGVGTDLFGAGPVDHPAVGNTGPGGTVRDRGAFERTGLRTAGITLRGDQVRYPRGVAPFAIQAKASAQSEWNSPLVSYSYDFGDGTAPVVSTSGAEIGHTYEQPGSYYVVATLTDARGERVSTTSFPVEVSAPADLVADFTTEVNTRLGVHVASTSTSPYRVTGVQVDFGDGTVLSNDQFNNHAYQRSGTYDVKVTVTDDAGRTASRTKQVVVKADPAYEVLLPSQRVQVIARTSAGLLDAGNNLDRNLWSPFAPVGATGASFSPDQVTALTTVGVHWDRLRTFAVAGGRIYAADRSMEPFHLVGSSGGMDLGQWTSWSEVTAATGAGALPDVTQVAAAAIGTTTHLVAVSNGRVYEASHDRATDRWSAWGDITGEARLPAGTTRIAVATIGNALHVAALGADGRVRIADGDYTAGRWSSGDLSAAIGNPAGITELSAAAIDSKFHVLALAGGNVHQATGDYRAGTWTTWADVTAVTGLRGSVTQLSATTWGGSYNTLRLYGVSGGHVFNANGDYTAGRWSTWADVTAPGAGGATAPVTLLSAAQL
ncbi:PKD domain-containing protein [Kitasatospora sp. NPDC088346]|uniref:PKD domain-containing protein n=1 Tax=Kitasatospora sp. NPDC088346 TaxID=3364073 RepID=UPI0037F4F2D2